MSCSHSLPHTNTLRHKHLFTHTVFTTVNSTIKGPCTGFLTCEGASLGAEFSGHAYAGAQVEHDEHGGDHDDALPQQQRLKVATKPEGEVEKVGMFQQYLTETGNT